MTEQPKIQPVDDEELKDAAGGQSPESPAASGIATSGPENDIGSTCC